MAKFPFSDDVESLLERMDSIPVDTDVPFADLFEKILRENDGNPWGPQASDRSKLATRLHFAGWSRQELEQVGLKPKDVENFRHKFNMKVGRGSTARLQRKAPNIAGLIGSPLDAHANHAKQAAKALQTPQVMLADAIKHRDSVRAILSEAETQRLRLDETIRELQQNIELADNIINMIKLKIKHSEGNAEE